MWESQITTVYVLRARYPEPPVSLLGWSMGATMVLNTFYQYEPAPSTVILLAGRVKGVASASQKLRPMAYLVKSFFVRDAWFDNKPMVTEVLMERKMGQIQC